MHNELINECVVHQNALWGKQHRRSVAWAWAGTAAAAVASIVACMAAPARFHCTCTAIAVSCNTMTQRKAEFILQVTCQSIAHRLWRYAATRDKHHFYPPGFCEEARKRGCQFLRRCRPRRRRRSCATCVFSSCLCCPVCRPLRLARTTTGMDLVWCTSRAPRWRHKS